jgi:acrylyl-CoA reductase (NADPH)
MPRRRKAWTRLARDLNRDKLRLITRTIALGDVFAAAEEILAGKVRGRLVVDLSR